MKKFALLIVLQFLFCLSVYSQGTRYERDITVFTEDVTVRKDLEILGQLIVNTVTSTTVRAGNITGGTGPHGLYGNLNMNEKGIINVDYLGVQGNPVNSIYVNNMYGNFLTGTTLRVGSIIFPADNTGDIGESNKRANEIFVNQLKATTVTGATVQATTFTGGNITFNTDNTSDIGESNKRANEIFVNELKATTVTGATIKATTFTGGNITFNTDDTSDIGESNKRANEIFVNQLKATTVTGATIKATTFTGGNITFNTDDTSDIGESNKRANEIFVNQLKATTVTGATVQATTFKTTLNGDAIQFYSGVATGNIARVHTLEAVNIIGQNYTFPVESVAPTEFIVSNANLEENGADANRPTTFAELEDLKVGNIIDISGTTPKYSLRRLLKVMPKFIPNLGDYTLTFKNGNYILTNEIEIVGFTGGGKLTIKGQTQKRDRTGVNSIETIPVIIRNSNSSFPTYLKHESPWYKPTLFHFYNNSISDLKVEDMRFIVDASSTFRPFGISAWRFSINNGNYFQGSFNSFVATNNAENEIVTSLWAGNFTRHEYWKTQFKYYQPATTTSRSAFYSDANVSPEVHVSCNYYFYTGNPPTTTTGTDNYDFDLVSGTLLSLQGPYWYATTGENDYTPIVNANVPSYYLGASTRVHTWSP